jgi:uncharacterized membrane protein
MMFGGWDMMEAWNAGGGFWMAMAMVLIAVVVVTGIWLIVRSNRAIQAIDPTPDDILGRRFARGEITQDEYQAAKRTLKG